LPRYNAMQKSILHRFWISGENGFMLGQGRVQILESIIEHGSISKAAKALEMSYKKAWRLVNGMNDASETSIVIRNSGGVGGGGTTVTQRGIELIKAYRNLEKRTNKYFEKESKKIEW